MNDEIIRILITTDNHLGFLEKDSIRGDDSFSSFEESLSTARHKKVDFMLLAGDLFHENKPSRYTMHSTIELLRKYCLGNDSVYTEILNEQSEVFKSANKVVNYEDPFQSISLPIYSIHGNHDDPTRECGRFDDSLAPLDILSAANLINYFGKSDHIDEINITPLLIRKGEAHVAIYGLGAVRDERLNRLWNQKKVKFNRPSFEQGKDKYFNIFVLHQNRDCGRGTKNCIHESMIPEWIDVVIWGNEHECVPKLVESLVGTYRIYQPGSSVVTSLCQGESFTNPKHMGLLEIRKTKEYRLTGIPFIQQRPFIYREISLSSPEFHLDTNDPKIDEKIKKVLAKEINKMINEGREFSIIIEEQNQSLIENTNSDNLSNSNQNILTRKFLIKSPKHVLVRLRVEHTGFTTINAQRFGSQFLNQVANPGELLLFAKHKIRDIDNVRAVEGYNRKTKDGIAKILKEGVEEEINKIKIEDLVTSTLQNSNKQLTILPEIEMAKALDDFIVKRFIHAISGTVEEALKLMKSELIIDPTLSVEAIGTNGVPSKTAIIEAALKIKQKTEDESKKGVRVFAVKNESIDELDDNDDVDIDSDTDVIPGRGSASSRGGRGSAESSSGRVTGRGSRGGGRGSRGGRSATATTSQQSKKPTGTSSAQSTSVSSRGRGGRGVTGGRGAATKKYSKKSNDDDDEDDEIIDDDNDDDVYNNNNSRNKKSTTTANTRSSPLRSQNNSKNLNLVIDDIDAADSDIEIIDTTNSYNNNNNRSNNNSSNNNRRITKASTSSPTRSQRPSTVSNNNNNNNYNNNYTDLVDSEDDNNEKEENTNKYPRSSTSTSTSTTRPPTVTSIKNTTQTKITSAFNTTNTNNAITTASSKITDKKATNTQWQSSQKHDTYDTSHKATAIINSSSSSSVINSAAKKPPLGTAASHTKLAIPSYLKNRTLIDNSSLSSSIPKTPLSNKDLSTSMLSTDQQDEESCTDTKRIRLSGWD